METSMLVNTLGHPGLAMLLDLLLKSVLILSALAAAIYLARPRLSSTTAHLLWLGGLVGVALTAVSKLFFSAAPAVWQGMNAISVFTVTPVASNSEAVGRALNSGAVLLAIYLAVAAFLLIKLVHAAYKLQQLDGECHLFDDNIDKNAAELTAQCKTLCLQLNIDRDVQLKTGEDVTSPLSYGLRQPTVLVPRIFATWPAEVREEVLLHELSHIKRYDWPTLIFTRLVASLLWLNPLVWLASKQLHDEAEQACDCAIIRADQDRVRYAENLLNIAKTHRATQSTTILAQPMYDGGELTMRIKNILEGKLGRNFSRRTLSALLLCIGVIAVAGNGVQIFAADDGLRDQEYLPIRTQVPYYPRRAADEGIEGWILYSFTVRSDGMIDPNTVAVVDAEPPGYFETSAKNALLNFEFEPRISDGLAVDVPGVQYLFRYELEPGGSSNFDRPPPQANPR